MKALEQTPRLVIDTSYVATRYNFTYDIAGDMTGRFKQIEVRVKRSCDVLRATTWFWDEGDEIEVLTRDEWDLRCVDAIEHDQVYAPKNVLLESDWIKQYVGDALARLVAIQYIAKTY